MVDGLGCTCDLLCLLIASQSDPSRMFPPHTHTHVTCARTAAAPCPTCSQERKKEAILSANAERVRRLERERRNGNTHTRVHVRSYIAQLCVNRERSNLVAEGP